MTAEHVTIAIRIMTDLNMPSAADDVPSERATVSAILENVQSSREEKARDLLPIVYQQLRALAQQRLSQERPGHTLQATALVHEAFCRLVGDRKVPWDGPGHFYVAAAEAMRHVLLDHAKARGRQKRGGNRKRLPIHVVDLAESPDYAEALALDEALRRLHEEDIDAANVVRLRFFAGLSIDETAAALGLSPRTVDRRWEYARAWLYRELSCEPNDSEPS